MAFVAHKCPKRGRHFVFFWSCSCTLNVKFCIPSADFAPSLNIFTQKLLPGAPPRRWKWGGRGPGDSEARIFFRGKPIPKTENSADLTHYFPENGGDYPPHSQKWGGRVPPRPPLWRSPWLLLVKTVKTLNQQHISKNNMIIWNWNTSVHCHGNIKLCGKFGTMSLG